jgi:ribonuclease HI
MSKITVFELIHALSGIADPNETVASLSVDAAGSVRLNGRDIISPDEEAPREDPLGRGTLVVEYSDDVELWTDGACSGNPGPGGWAYCLVKDGRNVGQDSGYAPETTNNRMEMQAVIAGLARLHAGATVTVRTDSQLIVDTIQKGWKRKKNCDLWTQLDAAIARHDAVTFQHVKGHDGQRWNEHVDQLAVAQYQQRQ